MAKFNPLRDAVTDTFSHFRYVISRLDEERPALLDGTSTDIETAKEAVRAALERYATQA